MKIKKITIFYSLIIFMVATSILTVWLLNHDKNSKKLSLNPISSASADAVILDSDSDGISDKDEIEIYHTNPNNPDSDNDGYEDKVEIVKGYNPNGEGSLKTALSEKISKLNIADKEQSNSPEIQTDSSAENFENKNQEFTSVINQKGNSEITEKEVASHNLKSDCWTIVSGKVYDITPIMAWHSNVVSCGGDSTSLYLAKHGDLTLVKPYYLGELNNNSSVDSSSIEILKAESKVDNKLIDTTEIYITKSVISQIVSDNIGELIYEIDRIANNNFKVRYIIGSSYNEAKVDGEGNVFSAVNLGLADSAPMLKDIKMHNYVMDFEAIVSKVINQYSGAAITKIEPKVGYRYIISFKYNKLNHEVLVAANGMIEKIIK